MKDPVNLAASVHHRLKNTARQSGERFNDLLQHYALERFLHRLAESAHRDQFILKGALMLRVWRVAQLRPTRDIDLLGRVANDAARMAAMIRGICETDVKPDGMEFDAESVKVAPIAANAKYEGLQATFAGRLGSAKLPMRIDVGFGDRVTPGPVEIEYPSVLDGQGSRLLGYTPETTIAEKLHVMLDRGIFNSRVKDFFDIWALSLNREFDGRTLSMAIQQTCANRSTAITGNPEALQDEAFSDSQRAAQWTAFRSRLGAVESPLSFAEVGRSVSSFLRPVLEAVAAGTDLDRRWVPGGPWVPFA